MSLFFFIIRFNFHFLYCVLFFFKQKTAYEMRISDWSSDVCSSDLQKEAQIIRGNADGEAARIYSASFGKDPEFYDFYRAMQSYRQTFLGENNQGTTSVILSPNNEYLRHFKGG